MWGSLTKPVTCWQISNSRPNESNLWERPSVAMLESVLASTRIALWTCIELLFLMKISVAASVTEPVATARPQERRHPCTRTCSWESRSLPHAPPSESWQRRAVWISYRWLRWSTQGDIFFIESSIYCQIDSSQCLAYLTPARVGIARSVHVQLGVSTHVIRWDIICLSPQSHTSVWESFHIFIMARQRPFLHSQPIRTPPSGPGLICAAGQVFIWDDPSVTPLSWSITQGVPLLYPKCGTSILFWGGIKSFCWVKKAVSGWKPVLGRTLAMEWVSRVIFLEAVIWVAGNLSAYVRRGYPRQCIQAGYWGSL